MAGDRLLGTRRRDSGSRDKFFGHIQFAKRSQESLETACASRNVATRPNAKRGQNSDSSLRQAQGLVSHVRKR